MTECGYCNKNLRSEDVKLIILCTGPCERAFHIGCTELNEAKTRSNLGQKRGTWKCKECTSKAADNCTEITQNTTKNVEDSNMIKILNEINSKVSKIDTIEKILDNYETTIADTTKKNGCYG